MSKLRIAVWISDGKPDGDDTAQVMDEIHGEPVRGFGGRMAEPQADAGAATGEGFRDRLLMAAAVPSLVRWLEKDLSSQERSRPRDGSAFLNRLKRQIFWRKS